MQKPNVQQILEELKQAYPEYELSSLLIQPRGGRYLFIVKGFAPAGDIDDWSINVVYPLFGAMWRFLKQREGALQCVRLLFVRGNQFVLYSPDIGLYNVFRNMTKPVDFDCYGGYEYQHYVGECLNIEDVLEYLTTTNVRF